MSLLLGTLLSLLDQIHELKKHMYVLEHQCPKNHENHENTLYLENAIDNAAFELQVLQSHVEFLKAQAEDVN